MPSRAAHLIAFLTIVALSVSVHVYIFRQFARMIRRDFPDQQKRILGLAKGIFIYFELPFLYIFFGKQINFDASLVTTILIYPFAVWQMLMLVWAVILIPIGVVRSRASRVFLRSSQKLLLKPIARFARRSLSTRRKQVLEPAEEIA